MAPTLADDEARLADLAAEFHHELVAAIPGWVARVVTQRLGRTPTAVETERIRALGGQLATRLDNPLHEVLTADVDARVGSPLAVLRGAAGPLSDLLDELAVSAPPRDEFTVRHLPDDRHGVGPATFSDVAASLHEPGVVWGAARAHVHLRRRREAER